MPGFAPVPPAAQRPPPPALPARFAPTAGPPVIQRVAVKLQPQDSVVKELVTYARKNLSVDRRVHDSLTDARKTVGPRENVFLFGHGGNSRVDLEEHDMFGGKTVPQLADEIAENLNFADRYNGTIFLIGCKTASVVSALKAALRERTGQKIRVQGTTELLQTTSDGTIVQRDPPQGPDATRMRESIDMQRHFYPSLVQLKNQQRATIQALRRARTTAEKRAAAFEIIDQDALVTQNLGAIDNGLALLADTERPALVGRREGLAEARESFAKARTGRAALVGLLEQLLALHPRDRPADQPQPDDAAIIAQIVALLQPNVSELSDAAQVWALLIGVHDEPDVLETKPFDLRMMVPKGRMGRRKVRRRAD